MTAPPPAPLPDLDRLAFFAAVAESGGFTAAADRLAVAKAKVSLEVRRLEAALGVNLFHRTTRRVVLTETGRQLHAASAPLLRELADTLAQAGNERARVAGRLRISTPVNYAANMLGKIVADFARLHPALSVELSATDRIVDLVAEGIDVAIRAGWLRSSSLRATRLGEMEQCVVAAPAYLRARGAPKRPADLATHEWIALSLLPSPLTWKFRSKRGRTVIARVRSRLATDSPDALHALVVAGAGVTVLTEDMVVEDLKRGRLQRLLADWSLPHVGVYAVYPPGRHIPANARTFVEFCRARFGSHDSPDPRTVR
jgi:DNA-binding transcriptional LysR family regulator